MSFQWISKDQPAVVLAPMEGVTDAPMRALLSARGGLSFCVSEFLRISQDLLPPKVYFEHIPELKSGCRTPSGVPIQVQLLGGDEELLALSALRAVELGAQAVDLNFGCPAPTVNRHDGGAAILRYPDRIRSIVSAVRAAVPRELPVSAKLRLGWDDMESIHVNAQRAAEGGASWITIHARTKVQGYVPPAHWRYIGEVRKALDIPVVANGEIWSREDFLRCQEETQCIHYMLGRGALADPELAWVVSRELGIALPAGCESESGSFSTQASHWLPLIEQFAAQSSQYVAADTQSQYTVRRVKQWVKMANLKKSIPWFEQIKRTQTLEELYGALEQVIQESAADSLCLQGDRDEQKLPSVQTIDCQYLRPEFAASFLLIENGRATFVENNTFHSVPLLLQALRDQGLKPTDVDYVMITHVHLDHAGGTHALMEACPSAKLIAHPRAATHMIDPTRLIEGARKVYGEERFKELYGTLGPIDPSRVQIQEDDSRLKWGSREFRFLHTRGHANHHFCIQDIQADGTSSIFTGDSFGLRYPALQSRGLFIFPSTSPSDFDPEEAFRSFDRILNSGAAIAYLTHYGALTDLPEAHRQLTSWMSWSEALLLEAQNSSLDDAQVDALCQARVLAEMQNRLDERGIEFTSDLQDLLRLDLELNAAGIAFTAKKRRAKTKA